MLTLMLAAGIAEADDLAFMCVSLTVPADALPWAYRSEGHGAAQAAQVAYDAVVARVDAACTADCAAPTTECPARSCGTEAGDTVSWEATWSSDTGSRGETSEGVLSVSVTASPDAALGWTSATLTRDSTRYSSGHSYGSSQAWSVSWTGTLDARWPVDGAFSARTASTSDGDSEGWSDAECSWSTGRSYDDLLDVTMNGVNVFVGPADATVCGDASDGIRGVRAYIDRAFVGLVHPATLVLLAGTDDDGDGWLPEHGDCDDARADVHCDAPDVAYDGLDQNCAGGDERDRDRDGFEAAVVGGADCDDDDATVYPGAPEVPGDGVDQDCSGMDSPATSSSGVDTADTDLNGDAEPDAVGADALGGCSHAPRASFPLALLVATALLTRRSRRNA